MRYTGGIYDQSTGFTKFGQCWYNPQQGRFTQQDSLSFIGNLRDGNRYAYAAANPVNYIDPTGMYSWDDLWGDLQIVGGAAGAGAVVAGPAGLGAGAVAGLGLVLIRRGCEMRADDCGLSE
ncbi:RHS repeat-associated core domain-containing protein [Micromonospora marina]|uniref:RHS repeat-associated core domain-containing protein n=1 Tax=Micromonospora marina TaxID=307120 RepID=UPI001FC995E4|nr:RHS repeat-associated core domain-containing protein [Micromonospora marina]